VVFKHHEDHPETTRTIFDPTLNDARMYGPFEVTPQNQGLMYNHIDLFYLILGNIASLSAGSFNSSSLDFQQLHSYLTPSYDQMMNSTKHLFHSSLQNDLASIAVEQLVLIFVLSFVLLLAAVCISYNVYSYHRNMAEVFDIIIQFNNTDIDNIIKYWHSINEHFRKLGRMQQPQDLGTEMNGLKEGSDSAQEEFEEEKQQSSDNKVSLNQKHKEVITSPSEARQKCKLIGLVAALLVGLVPAVLAIPVFNLASIRQLTRHEAAGFYLMQHYPTTVIAGYALLDRRYGQLRPTEYSFQLSRFADTLSSLQLITDYSFIAGLDDNSVYAQKEKNYLFGNVCAANPAVLTKAMSTPGACIALENRALTNGITSYLRTVQPKVQGYLMGNVTLTDVELNDLTVGLGICSYFFTDALNSWQSEFSGKLDVFASGNVVYSIVVCLLMVVLQLVVVELALLSNLRHNYRFMRSVFLNWVPEHILTKEKVIKHRFYQSGILPPA
jgi:ABC-type multidrug transport system fused ATPase/permease subunit